MKGILEPLRLFYQRLSGAESGLHLYRYKTFTPAEHIYILYYTFSHLNPKMVLPYYSSK